MANKPTPSARRHKKNKDGSYDSVCLTCYSTIVRSVALTELATHDVAHTCESAFLAERGILSAPGSIGRPSNPLHTKNPFDRPGEAA